MVLNSAYEDQLTNEKTKIKRDAAAPTPDSPYLIFAYNTDDLAAEVSGREAMARPTIADSNLVLIANYDDQLDSK